ncbi:MAG: ABC transporter permease [Actinomycetota bacterium]
MNPPWRSLFVGVVAVLFALAASGLFTLIDGVSPFEAYRELFNGALGSSYSLGVTANKAAPLILAALGFLVAARTGAFNIGLEGQLYVGALGAAIAGSSIDLPRAIHIPLCILAAALGGALWGAFPALLKIHRGVNEIVSSLLLNYVAILLTGYLISKPLRDPGSIFPQTRAIDDSAKLPILVGDTRLNAGVVVTLLAAAAVFWLLRFSRLGYEMRTVGGNPRAAEFANISTTRSIFAAFLISGALAGIGGAVEMLGSQFRLVENFSDGIGFTGIVVALLGALSPVGSVIAGTFFGVLISGANQMERVLGISANLVIVIQGAAVLFVVGGRSIAEFIARFVTRHRGGTPRRAATRTALMREERDRITPDPDPSVIGGGVP